MTRPVRPGLAAVTGIVVGAVVLVLVTALLTVGAASLRTDDRTGDLLKQLHEAQGQIAALQADATAEQNRAATERAQLQQQNTRLQQQNTRVQVKLSTLIRYLRDNGLPIPAPIAGPKGSASPPKVPTPSGATTTHPRPNSTTKPTPGTGTTPSTPSTPGTPGATGTTDPTCIAIPLLCQLTGR